MTSIAKRAGEDGLWIGIVTVASILFSLALACASPIAAIAAIAGTRMRLASAVALTVIAWLANQLVGYLVLGYPVTADSFAWGAVIGLAAVAAVVVVAFASRRLASAWSRLAGSFVLAFVTYELVLYAATAVLPSGHEAFSRAVIGQILLTNLAGLAGLILLHRAATAVGLIGEDISNRAVTG
jgi:hypothetical protein